MHRYQFALAAIGLTSLTLLCLGCEDTRRASAGDAALDAAPAPDAAPEADQGCGAACAPDAAPDRCPEDPAKNTPGVCGCGVPDADADGDGTLDCEDDCPDDGAKTEPGACGCNAPDRDSDGDETADCLDQCPLDADKTEPGLCGCGLSDTDTDGDEQPDCEDGCPQDPAKSAPGGCGCGVPDADGDEDGVLDCEDLCPEDAGKQVPGGCGCGVPDDDGDEDGVLDCEDACPEDGAKTAPGICGCGVGDGDRDADETADCLDGCPDDAAKIAPLECGCGAAETPNCDEVDAPAPNPAEWSGPPRASGTTSIVMDAIAAEDASEVEYLFECVEGGCADSGWQAEPRYEDRGLAPDHSYAYRFKVRDLSLNRNETEWSSVRAATTDSEPGYRAGWDALYYDLGAPVGALPALSERAPDLQRVEALIEHEAAPWAGLDERFAEAFASRHVGFLRVQSPADYTLFVSVSAGGVLWLGGEPVLRAVAAAEVSFTRALEPGYHPIRIDTYADAPGAALRFSWSTPEQEKQVVPTTALYRAAPPDLQPPTPNPLRWLEVPTALGSDTVSMRVAPASDPSGVHYYFECVAGPCTDSGWQADTLYRERDLSPGSDVTYRVRARDLAVGESGTEWSAEAGAITDPFVPDLQGLPEAEAEAALAAAALVVGEISHSTHPEAPAGEVIGQSPAPGLQARAGEAVDLVVSLGPPIPVPELAGEQAGAVEALIAAGLVLGEVRAAPSCVVAAGHLVGQTPPAGTEVHGGVSVDLVVSRGPDAAVINEIMYHPELEHLPREFLELHNPCVSPLDLAGWSLAGAGRVAFTAGTTLAAGGYFVFAQDAVAFEAVYGWAPDGTYGGTLSNGGETISLLRPDETVADEVTWGDRAPWPTTPDGLGPSLELVDPNEDNDTPRNWRASIAPAGRTPSGANSVRAVGLPPWITEVDHGEPEADTPIAVSARVEDAEAVAFTYVVDWGEPVQAELLDDGLSGDGEAGDGVYGVVLPGQPLGSMLRYRIDATGPTGAMSYPRDDDTVTYRGTYLVDPAITSRLPVLHWIMAPAAYAEALRHFRNNQTEPAAIFHEGVLYTGAQVRVRGQSSRGNPKKHWKVQLPKGNPFFGEALAEAPQQEFNLQASYADKSYLREILSYETFRDAGAPSHLAAPVAVYQNGAFFGLYIWVEDKDSQQVARNGWDGDGAFYKGYSQCEAQTLQRVQQRFEKKNPGDGDYTELHALIAGINTLAGEERRDFIFDHIDIAAMNTYQAASVLTHNNDQVAKNYFIYQDRNGGGRWTFHVWDVDLTFGRSFEGRVLNDRIFAADDEVGRNNVSPSHPLFGDRLHQKWDFLWNRITDAVLAEPEIREMYYRRLRTVMDGLLPPGRYEARIDELAALIAEEAAADKAKWGQYGVPETLETAVTRLKEEYFALRRTHLFETHRVPGEIPEAQSANPAIVISELMYSPAEAEGVDAGQREFIELYNPSPTESVDLSGWRVEGVEFIVPAGTVMLPEGRLLLVRDEAAFRAAYGGGHYVGGQYGGTLASGRLAGDGERVALLDHAGALVDEVTYDHTAPWPVAADGGGASLELIDLASDNGVVASWAASLVPGGTPGVANSVNPP